MGVHKHYAESIEYRADDKGFGTLETKDGITKENAEKIDESDGSGTEQIVTSAISDIQVDKEIFLDSTTSETKEVLGNHSVYVKETENIEISETKDVLTNSSLETVNGSLTLATKQKVDSESSREEERAISNSNGATPESNLSGETISVPLNVSLELAPKIEQVEEKSQTKTKAPTSAGSIYASLVKQVSDMVSIGQEVTVRI